MIYTGLGRLGEIADIKAHGGADVAEVYGGINESNPIYYKTRTITGQTPLSYKALSKPLSDYLISGNTLQDGTPSPDMPVDVVGCGERTGNLFDKTTCDPRTNIYLNQNGGIGDLDGSNLWTISGYIWLERGKYYAYGLSTGGTGTYCCIYNPDKTFARSVLIVANTPTAITINNGGYVRLSVRMVDNEINSAMLVPGTFEPQSYIPYGYKLAPTVNGTEYPIYLGQVPTVRKIRKVVFDGTEQGWGKNTRLTNSNAFLISMSNWVGNRKIGYCTHYQNVTDAQAAEGIFFGNFLNILTALADGLDDETKFKQWLADQYAAGTPVTVWYVLAEPETGIINEPLHKIGDYADTISFEQTGVTIPTVAGANTLTVDTTVQPSVVSITGNIKEVQGT